MVCLLHPILESLRIYDLFYTPSGGFVWALCRFEYACLQCSTSSPPQNTLPVFSIRPCQRSGTACHNITPLALLPDPPPQALQTPTSPQHLFQASALHYSAGEWNEETLVNSRSVSVSSSNNVRLGGVRYVWKRRVKASSNMYYRKTLSAQFREVKMPTPSSLQEQCKRAPKG